MLKVINPANQALIQDLEEDTAQSVSEKFKRAHSAQTAWAKIPVSKKIEILNRFKDLLARDKEKLANLLTSETGKPISQARNELNAVGGRIDFFNQNVEKVLKDENVFVDPSQKLEEKISHEPLGVVANISAWNYPYFVGANVFVPALLTGNAVLYKPSEFSSLTGLAIANLLHEAGVPKDVFIPIIGSGAVGAKLLEQAIQGVFFTGSYPTGKKIAAAAAEKMIKIQLELGGKDPSYICDDADIRTAAESTADGAFYNTGQSCCSVERIYVHEKIYDRFVEHFMKTVNGFTLGEPTEDKTYIGALTRSAQITVLDQQVADAKAKGAKLLCGGKRADRKGNYYEPTVFVDVNHTMEVMREESFGPIIGIQKVKSDEEAIALMNDTNHGLTAGVYTPDRERAIAVLSRIHSGSVYWNCCDRVSPRLPWSGRKNSGMGSTLSTYGIQAFLQPKAWHLKG